ncbi:threonine--tRNA ligase, cytoplasmic isoform X1 [Echeneis naucrates]|uniref:threonine--tRNA ligase, cytoplasmic isoform X1 n=1 Tax=Echeneis naucrates TaxID=173247 RepID=UPI001113DD83|nr:threonine--tRNA ligase, cytoplasmic-like isoform X1 [Echeneis naucrates]
MCKHTDCSWFNSPVLAGCVTHLKHVTKRRGTQMLSLFIYVNWIWSRQIPVSPAVLWQDMIVAISCQQNPDVNGFLEHWKRCFIHTLLHPNLYNILCYYNDPFSPSHKGMKVQLTQYAQSPSPVFLSHNYPEACDFLIYLFIFFTSYLSLCLTTTDFSILDVLPEYIFNHSVLSLNDVENMCKEAAAFNLPLSTLELNIEEVQQLFQSSKLRLQLVRQLMNGPTVTIYRCGDSVGVCSGPLLPHTGLLKIFKMLQLSPVTLANQTDTSTLMRLFGVAFPAEKEKNEWERELEEARRRDHRRIGTDQELFFFNDVSPGSCFFMPKGAHIYNTLTNFIKSEYQRRGFNEVVTPTLYTTALWERSGHWEHYSDNMFTVTLEGSQTYALKPMNCPAHCLMFEQRVRSWRELPLRWADFGALHRNELSGALGGLTRVRRFCQDDAHIFCTPDQLEQEIVACLDFVRSVYRVFGFSFHCLLSTRPTPCLGEPEQWDNAEQQLERSLKHFGERWELNPGDGAFYGPKIDIQIKDAIGRQHQCATIQLDFQLPIRFHLQYVGKDGQLHRPVMIHRAVLGSLERMIAILAENFGGKWPLWLSPAQVMVIPVGGNSESYAKQVVQQFREAGFLADLNDDQGATLNKKIRSAQLAQFNYIFVVGDKERESGTVNVRSRRGKQLGRRPIEEVLTSLKQLRDTRSNQDEF